MPQTRLHITAGKSEAERIFAALDTAFEEDGLPIAVLEVDEDRASARSYFRYYRRTDGVPTLAAMGVYADTFVRTAAGWRLHHRVISRG